MFNRKRIKTLEEEIDSQDKQYKSLQARLSMKEKECELIKEEKEHYKKKNDDYLDTIKQQRRQINELSLRLVNKVES